MSFANNIKNNNHIYSNRGMGLERDINLTNNYYLINDIAIIHKKPTPITIKKVEYPNKNFTKIIDGYFAKPSTTDYNGLYKGKYIDFEAKETKQNKYFPLTNIHNHQIEHIKRVINHGGISFIIVHFSLLNKTFYLDGNDFINFIEDNKRKSIPYEYFEDKGYLIEVNYNPRLNYLKIIDNIYFKGDEFKWKRK